MRLAVHRHRQNSRSDHEHEGQPAFRLLPSDHQQEQCQSLRQSFVFGAFFWPDEVVVNPKLKAKTKISYLGFLKARVTFLEIIRRFNVFLKASK